MELKTFVTESLVQIVQGVVDAAGRVALLGGAVSPTFGSAPGVLLGRARDGNMTPVHAVEFDVALTVARSSGSSTSETLTVAAVAINSSENLTEGQEELSSRIRFTVPLQLPTDANSLRLAEKEKRANEAAVQHKIADSRGSTRGGN